MCAVPEIEICLVADLCLGDEVVAGGKSDIVGPEHDIYRDRLGSVEWEVVRCARDLDRRFVNKRRGVRFG